MLKSTLIALLAFAATVSAQNTGMPDHIAFTQPVGDGNSYEPGSTKIFSWHGACVSPGTLTSITPTQAKVELVDSTDSNNAVFRKDVTTIDCTKPTGNVQWVVPTDQNPDAMYSLQIVLTPRNAYSGKFTIKSASSKPAPTQGGSGGEDKTPSSASSLAPAALTAAAAAAGALLLF
ncbi:hypothetical protein BGW41_006593 [Actinomortierella wolfii]|nr:hypothetical protein BGW41_006593 [Actinomortierella wolfii]